MRHDERIDYYDGKFAPYMAEFIRYKRAQGLKYDNTVARSLRQFSRFLAAKGVGDSVIDRTIINEWCNLRTNEGYSTQRLRISHTKQFLKFLAEKGFEVSLPRNSRQKQHPSSFTPYIFSYEELSCFFKACDSVSARTPSVMPAMLPLLFRLLYGCGLRISEALALQVGDVNFKAGTITVRNAKFDKDRLIPLSISLLERFIEYSMVFHKLSPIGARYFTHRDGRSVRKNTIYGWYRRILWSAGIPHGGKGKGPRLHDFRHTFSVHSLKAMTDKEMDIYCALPLLSTYLGHTSVSSTGQYVRLTQDMFPEVVTKASAIAAFVIPGGEQL